MNTTPRVRVLRSFCTGIGKSAEVGVDMDRDDLPTGLYHTLLAGGAIEDVAPAEEAAADATPATKPSQPGGKSR